VPFSSVPSWARSSVWDMWGTDWVGCGRLGVGHRRVFRGGEQVGAGGMVGVLVQLKK